MDGSTARRRQWRACGKLDLAELERLQLRNEGDQKAIGSTLVELRPDGVVPSATNRPSWNGGEMMRPAQGLPGPWNREDIFQ